MTTIEEMKDVYIHNDYEAFTAIKKHLLTQNQKSLDYFDACQYRGQTFVPFESDSFYSQYVDDINEDNGKFVPTGLSCAVGILIKEDMYSPEIEGNSIDDNFVQEAITSSHPDWDMNTKSIIMLQVLQRIHDNSEPSTWNKYLQAVEVLFFTEESLNYVNFNRYLTNVYENIGEINGIPYSSNKTNFFNIMMTEVKALTMTFFEQDGYFGRN
jgi:hypothetical protein